MHVVVVYKFDVVAGLKHGRGCIAREKITKGEVICNFQGESLSLKQLLQKYNGDNCNPIQVDLDEWIDLQEPLVCFNHSCNPNAGVRGRAQLFALRDINPGEEITFDYATTVNDDIWNMDCTCGEKECRGVIAHYLRIPPQVRKNYQQQGALPDYILKLYPVD